MRPTRIAAFAALSLAMAGATPASGVAMERTSGLTAIEYSLGQPNATYSLSSAPTPLTAWRSATKASSVSVLAARMTFTTSVGGSYHVVSPGSGYIYSVQSGGTAPYTYVWTVNGSFETTNSTVIRTFCCAGSYYVAVTVTDANGLQASGGMWVTVT